MHLSYHEIAEILDTKNNSPKTEGYLLVSRFHEIRVLNLMLKSFFPDDVKVNFTIDDIRLTSNLTINVQ